MSKSLRGPTRPTARLRQFELHRGIPNLPVLQSEVQDMMDVLLGRVDPPINNGVLTLMEVADAYFARGSEIAMMILRGQREGTIPRGGSYAKFRTGELRHFLDVCKGSRDLGSRRVTVKQLTMEAERTGRSRLDPE